MRPDEILCLGGIVYVGAILTIFVAAVLADIREVRGWRRALERVERLDQNERSRLSQIHSLEDAWRRS